MGSVNEDGLQENDRENQRESPRPNGGSLATESRLEASRKGAEERLAAIRTAMKEEVGSAPKKGYLLLLLAAGATGFAIAARRFRRRKLRR